jgi:hypothetical protein
MEYIHVISGLHRNMHPYIYIFINSYIYVLIRMKNMKGHEYMYVSIHANMYQTCTYIDEYAFTHGYTSESKCIYADNVEYASI